MQAAPRGQQQLRGFHGTVGPHHDASGATTRPQPQARLSPEYAAYRNTIDALLEAAIHEHTAADDPPAARTPLHVLEICGGDGTLAERLLRREPEPDRHHRHRLLAVSYTHLRAHET